MSESLWPHGLQHARPPYPPIPRVYSNSCPLSQWCHPTISSAVPFSSWLQSSPASGSFLMSQFFTSGGQSIGVSASASVLPMNIQEWFPLGWTGWISSQSKRLSRVFSNVYIKSLQSCPTLCNPMDCTLPGSSVHGILQETILEWAAVSSSGVTLVSGISASPSGCFTTSVPREAVGHIWNQTIINWKIYFVSALHQNTLL